MYLGIYFINVDNLAHIENFVEKEREKRINKNEILKYNFFTVDFFTYEIYMHMYVCSMIHTAVGPMESV